jgi:hypothetical protein
VLRPAGLEASRPTNETQGTRMIVEKHSQQLPVWDIKALGVQERVLLFCLGSGTDWKPAGVTLKTVGRVVGMFAPFTLVKPIGGGPRALTDAGRAALRAPLRDR